MKYDWYQTDATVVVGFLTKDCKEEELTVNIQPSQVEVIRRLEDDDRVELNLHQNIDVAKSKYKIMKSKVEVTLAKEDSGRWSKLEKDITSTPPPASRVKNWDSIVKTGLGDEKEDENVNALFQNIYKGADENTRRAMNKSFIESGGTVLSTNWADIGSKKTEMKPPEGMEYKKYES